MIVGIAKLTSESQLKIFLSMRPQNDDDRQAIADIERHGLNDKKSFNSQDLDLCMVQIGSRPIDRNNWTP